MGRLTNKISRCLLSWCRGSHQDIVLPNFFVGLYEMDVFKLTGSGFLHEYEIKISRSDFKNDFKKKHSTGYGNERKNILKHDHIKNGDRACNKFFFVVPFNLVSPDEIPEHCGLIYYSEEGNWLKLIKNAKYIHKNKIIETKPDFYKQLSVKLSFRSTLLQEKIKRLENTITILKNKE